MVLPIKLAKEHLKFMIKKIFNLLLLINPGSAFNGI